MLQITRQDGVEMLRQPVCITRKGGFLITDSWSVYMDQILTDLFTFGVVTVTYISCALVDKQWQQITGTLSQWSGK